MPINPQEVQWDDINKDEIQWDDEATPSDYVQAAVGGANELVPALLGLPVDVATNIANLGIAGYGTVKGLMGGTDLPETLPPQAGGSEWIKQKITGLMGSDPFSPVDPQDPAQQKLHLAGGVMGAGLLAPAAGIKQAATNVARMAPGAGGAVAGQTLFPDQPLAPMVGMMAGLGAGPAISTAKAKIGKVPVKAFVKAHKLGYKVPPSHGKVTGTQQAVEGLAGPVPTKQQASVHNQQITNNLIKKDIGYPADAPLSPEGLNSIRTQAGASYEKVKNFGLITADKAYRQNLTKIAKPGTALAKEIPGMVKKDVVELTKMFNKKTFSSEALVDAVKQLRADSSAGYRSADPQVLGMAKAKGKIADQIELLIERNAATKAPDLIPELKASRQTIAKSYEVEKALRGENVDAVALGRALDKGKPLSGLMRDVAEFGQNFKHSAQINPPQTTNFRPMDLMAGIGSAVASGNVAFLAAAGIRPALRKLILSKPYQNFVAKMPPEDWQMILSLPAKSQVPAMAALLRESSNPQALQQPLAETIQ